MNFYLDSKDYLEVNSPTDLKVEHSGEVSEKKKIEALSESSGSIIPLARVVPAEIPCEVSKNAFLFKWLYCFNG